MKRQAWIWQLMGFAITSLGGTLLHFLYDWLEKSPWIAPFSGINESTWEHMKLLFWPMFIYSIFQGFFFGDVPNYWCIKLKGIFIGLTLIPTIFYTYNGVIGPSPDWFNITIFFISAIIAYIYETRKFYSDTNDCKHPKLAFATLVTIAVLFVLFTFKTPNLEIFKDPLTQAYGMQ